MRHGDGRSDPRWTVARERTVLGWLRLSVGLLVTGLLVAFGPLALSPAVTGVAGAVLLLGAAAAGVGALVDR